MSLKVTILGCGTSGGVPRVGNHWGACDPGNEKNRRRRCSLLVQRKGAEGETAVLVDTSPDLRQQLLDAEVGWLDGVLYTHDHADHTHGIDDLRMLCYRHRKLIDIYCTDFTRDILVKRFDYCFETQEGSSYPPILKAHTIREGEAVTIEGAGGSITVLPFRQFHGEIESLGFRFGNLAYSSDVHDLPEESLPLLAGLDVWIVDALRYSTHPSHFSVQDALSWIERIRPKRAILTHMHIDLDYDTLSGQLPKGMEPAYDRMRFELAE
jgi:phosphoribosyl 1,2-cyclic phosphate phosphodiesterase